MFLLCLFFPGLLFLRPMFLAIMVLICCWPYFLASLYLIAEYNEYCVMYLIVKNKQFEYKWVQSFSVFFTQT